MITGSNSFTGTSDSCLNYSEVKIVILSDQNSAAGGISMEYSQNGTNWDIVETDTYYANSSYSQTFSIRSEYFRLVYTNGETDQGTFRLRTIFKGRKATFNNGFISLKNSTTTALAGDDDFTGLPDLVEDYNEISVSIYADVSGASGSIQMQFSATEATWTNTKVYRYTYTNGTTRVYVTPVANKYFRLVYTNGSSAQSTFKVHTLIRKSISSIVGELSSSGQQVTISNTKAAFGEIYAVQANPLVELDFVYGAHDKIITKIERGTNTIVSDATIRSHLDLTVTSDAITTQAEFIHYSI